MSRQQIADALSTIPGVSGHPDQPPAPVPGQGWPQWQRTVYAAGAGCTAIPDTQEWDVLLLLPALDPHSGDQLRDQVAAALSTVGTVTEARPDSIPLQPDQPSTPVVRFTLTTSGGT